MKKLGSLIILAMLHTSTVVAGSYTGNSEINSLSSISISDGEYGDYFIIRGGWTQADQTCPSSQSDTWIVTATSLEQVKSIYSMALTAYISNKKVELYQDGCINGRPKATHMYLPNR